MVKHNGKAITSAEVAKAEECSSKQRKMNLAPIGEADVGMTPNIPSHVRSASVNVIADIVHDLAEVENIWEILTTDASDRVPTG